MNALSGFTLIRRWLRNLVPVTTTFLFVLVGQLPLPLPTLSDVAPAFALISLYYWAVFRPDLMPYAAVFGLGIVQDAVAGAPFGMYALVYLLVQALVLNQRRFIAGKPFWVFWSAFALVAPIATFAAWILASLARGTFLAPETTLVALVMTIILFPVVAWLLVHAQRRFIGMVEA
ncbi:MAG: rod shape-determining protein MreD [Alphaproteobacteria bacterium]|nr:rod shape-determining protein MreD [Alphaproteobacteria bacterium]